MKKANYSNATFLISAAKLEQLPADHGLEIAFIGRSNAGKSSALNTITGIKSLAHTSKTPGRTQTINVYQLDSHRRFIDLPGYGYAKVPLTVKARWQETINGYLQMRQSLKGLVIIMDIRHPLKDSDQKIIHWAVECKVPLHVLLSKADKLNHGAAILTLKQVQETLEAIDPSISVQLFSSMDRTGLDEAKKLLDSWFSN